ncbi:MAG: ribonuclease III [Actinomycetia bacterium]|nr:ribonuclease III [Actinomycetes bacterium]
MLSALDVELAPQMLEQALTHRSYAYENGGLPTNERLEFLGDSVLGLVVTETLYLSHPDLPEGQLAKLRSAVVNMRALAEVARTIGLGEYLHLGKGEETTGGRDKASILADGIEALIGAVYVDRGIGVATEVVHRLFDPLLDRAPHLGAGLDWKTSLQELTATLELGVPEYRITESGPDHAKSFIATVVLRDGPHGSGGGPSKKEAEQEAAAATWESLAATSGEAATRPEASPSESGSPGSGSPESGSPGSGSPGSGSPGSGSPGSGPGAADASA